MSKTSKPKIHETESTIRLDFIRVKDADSLVHQVTKTAKESGKTVEVSINHNPAVTILPEDLAALNGSRAVAHVYAALRSELKHMS